MKPYIRRPLPPAGLRALERLVTFEGSESGAAQRLGIGTITVKRALRGEAVRDIEELLRRVGDPADLYLNGGPIRPLVTR